MWSFIQTEFWAVVLRVGQAAIAAAPYLLLGVLVAGSLRSMAGPKAVRRLFNPGRRGGLLRAWGLATLLPVCSIGVLPVARELRRAGVSRRAVLTFALAAPVLNPFSLIYALTLLQPWVLAVFVASTLAVSVGAGMLIGRDGGGLDPRDEDEPEMPATGTGRLFAAGAAAAREVAGPTAAYAAIGLLGVGLLAMVLPAGSLMNSMVYGNKLAPLMIAPVVALAHVTPERGVMLVGEMFEHSSSPGAAFVLLMLGCGVNLGLFAFLARAYGSISIARWSLCMLGLTLTLGYAINATCYLPGGEEGHTHIFDNFSSPFHSYSPAGAPSLVLDRLAESMNHASAIALGALLVLTLSGLALRTPAGRGAERALTALANRSPAAGPASPLSRPIPTRWLVAVSLAGLLALAAAGAYVYYPAPDDLFEDMRITRADALTAVNSGARADALRHVRHWETLAAKLPIGALLRRGSLDPGMRKEARELREGLEDLRVALQGDGESAGAKDLAGGVQRTYDRCRAAFALP